jgi:hypothetical protein
MIKPILKAPNAPAFHNTVNPKWVITFQTSSSLASSGAQASQAPTKKMHTSTTTSFLCAQERLARKA